MNDQLKPPYLRKAEIEGNHDVWIVDGAYIRGHTDEEFTNFGQHYRYPYIPELEFWIDQEGDPDEIGFFVQHLLVEYDLMSKGASYADAIGAADKAERRMRRRDGDVRKLTHHGGGLPDPSVVHKYLWKELENGVKVWIVSGRLVRSGFDIDFTAGGHEHVYEFVPKGEVWIDDDIEEEERGFVLLHELHERNRMAVGVPYSKAHAESSLLEFRMRHHPDELHDALAAEGWA